MEQYLKTLKPVNVFAEQSLASNVIRTIPSDEFILFKGENFARESIGWK
jgi:hypothetical protein